MKLTQIVELMQGELNNTPAIDAFNGVAFEISRLKKGNLFFAKNTDEIDVAVTMGAYGIVYDQDVVINDVEIAWIQVKDIQESMMRLLRYLLLSKNIEVFCLQDREFEIFSQICNDDSLLCYDDNVDFLLEKLFYNDAHFRYIVFAESRPLQYILDYTPSIVPQEQIIDIRVATLFDIQFYYNLLSYRLYLPILFVKELRAVLYFCANYKISFDLNLFKTLKSVQPNFIDSTPKILEYGSSDKVVIAQDNLQDFVRYVDYIAQNGKWGKMMVFAPEDCQEEFISPVVKYSDEYELLDFLKTEYFNFGLIFGLSNVELMKLMENKTPKVRTSLFDDFE